MAAPVLQRLYPADDTTGVSVTTPFVLVFSEAVQLNVGYINIYKSDGTLFLGIDVTDASQVSVSPSKPQLVMIDPSIDLLPGTSYYVLIDAGAIEDLDGEDFAGISSPTAFNFTTTGTPPAGDTTAPVLIATSPAINATGVAVGANIVLTFDEAVQAGSGTITIFNHTDATFQIIDITDSSQVTFSSNQVTIDPNADLAPGANYELWLTNRAVSDLADNPFVGVAYPALLEFTTVGGSDTSAPDLTGTSPEQNALNVAPDANIVLTFNEEVKAGWGTIFIINLADHSLVRAIDVTSPQVIFSGNQVTIDPGADLPEGVTVFLNFEWGVILDLANNPYPGLITYDGFNFTTADATAPLLISTSPADNEVDVAIGANLVLNFNEEVTVGSGNIAVRKVSDGSLVKNIPITDTNQVSFSANQVTLDPLSDFAPGVEYYVTFGADVIRDVAGNPFAGITATTEFTFTTAGILDETPPLLIGTTPADDAINVTLGSNLVFTFDEPIKLAGGTVAIYKDTGGPSGQLVEVIATYQTELFTVSGNQLTVNPIADLAPGTSYYVTISTGIVRDLSNNDFAGSYSATAFNFTTASGPSPFELPESGPYTNTISGSRRANDLTGTAANDKIDGKAGADTMTGLAGDDTYIVDNSSDAVVEAAGQGIDTVISSASSYVLADNVENLTLTGRSNHTATGNDLDNLITASSRADTIDGGAGNDIIIAGTGACILTGGDGNDMFVFPSLGSLKQITDFTVGEDLLDLRSLFASYGGSDPIADGVIALSSVAGGVLVSVDPSDSGTLRSLVTLTGISVGDLAVGTDILWT